MNKFLSFFALLLCACSVFAQGEDFSKYKLKEHNTVEEFQNAYLNKIITYLPDFSSGISSSQQMGLGNEPINFRVISITGKTKKNRDWQDMEWTIEEVDGDLRKTFNVHSGNYTQEIYYYNKDKEFLLRELQFYLLDEWKEDHKSEIGMLFESPLVKAKYMVVDVYLSIEKGIAIKELMKMYTVQNTITGKQYNYNSEKAHSLCFEEDLSVEYHASLARVEKPENPTVQYGKTTVVEDEGKTKYSYKDNYIDILIFCTTRQFYFTLKNVSDNTLKLFWDDAVFVDNNGSTSRVMHKGIKYSEREASQPASTIIRGASINDEVCPTTNVYWDEYLKEWLLDLIYPKDIAIEKKLNAPLETKQVQLMLPIQIKDVMNEYIFVFEIKYSYNHPERLNLPE